MKRYSKLLLFSLMGLTSLCLSVDIFQAIELNDKKQINGWLKSNPDYEVLNEKGVTPLIAAVQAGNKNLVSKLLKKDVDVNHVDVAGKTALDYAVELHNNGIMVVLVKNEGQVTSQDNVEVIKKIGEKQSGIIYFFKLVAYTVISICLAVLIAPVFQSFFWIPVVLIPIGVTFLFERDINLVTGYLLALYGMGFFIISPLPLIGATKAIDAFWYLFATGTFFVGGISCIYSSQQLINRNRLDYYYFENLILKI